jgi:diglucosylglycerate octanoyltransferase
VLAVRPDLPVAAVLPPPHRARCYASVHPGRAAGERVTRAWARTTGVSLLDLPALVTGHVLGGHGNPDGMHWGWAGHAAVGAACAELLRGVLDGTR